MIRKKMKEMYDSVNNDDYRELINNLSSLYSYSKLKNIEEIIQDGNTVLSATYDTGSKRNYRIGDMCLVLYTLSGVPEIISDRMVIGEIAKIGDSMVKIAIGDKLAEIQYDEIENIIRWEDQLQRLEQILSSTVQVTIHGDRHKMMEHALSESIQQKKTEIGSRYGIKLWKEKRTLRKIKSMTIDEYWEYTLKNTPEPEWQKAKDILRDIKSLLTKTVITIETDGLHPEVRYIDENSEIKTKTLRGIDQINVVHDAKAAYSELALMIRDDGEYEVRYVVAG